MSLLRRKKSNRVKPPRKKVQRRRVRVPERAINWRAVLGAAKTALVAGAVGVVGFTTWRVLDRPVTEIAVTAPFQRVTAMQIEDHVRRGLDGGILSSNLDAVRESLEALVWVDSVRIMRRWPTTLQIEVLEQVAAARWGDGGLLNTRGELFVESARHIPAELPALSGPDGSQWQVAQRYLMLRGPLLESGLQLLAVTLDKRGSWRLQLARGIEVRLGGHAVDQRIERFLHVVTPIIAGRAEAIDYVDLRYTNGFAIGWNEAAAPPATEGDADV